MSNYSRQLQGGEPPENWNRSINELDSDPTMSKSMEGMSSHDKQAMAEFERGFITHQKRREARKLAYRAQKRKEALRRKANLDRISARRSNKKYEEKVVNATYTHISAHNLADKVNNTMKYLHESTPKWRTDLLEEVYTDLEHSNEGKDEVEKTKNIANGFVVVGDQYTFELILEHEKKHGYASSLRGSGDDMRYHTAREPGKTLQILKPILSNSGQSAYETVTLKYGLPLARKSSIISYKNATWVSPDPKENLDQRTGVTHLASLMKELRQYTQEVQDVAKEVDVGQKYVGLKLKEMTDDELREQAKTIAFEILGPKAFFTMDDQGACKTSEWTSLLGTPKKPKRGDLSLHISEQAMKDNTWDDYSLPVQLNTSRKGREVKHTFCASPSSWELDRQGNRSNMLERRHPKVYHHLDDITKITKKEDAHTGNVKRDADIMRDMAFCGVASGKANKQECMSDIERPYPLTKDKHTRNARCRPNTETNACEPRWMTDKTSPLYQLYYGQGKFSGRKGYAQTEMDYNKEVLRQEESTGRKITSPDSESMDAITQSRWDTRMYNQEKMEKLYKEAGEAGKMTAGGAESSSIRSSDYLDSMSSLFSINSQ